MKKALIQWKGTDVCMDFHCQCGKHNHYDGYGAYFIKCDCGKTYRLSSTIDVTEVQDNIFTTPLENEH